MGFLFGLAILILIAAGLYYQRRQRKTWIAEERYEESGDWLDKRSSERGTYGSLDAEREQERKAVANQGRVYELARELRAYFFEHYPGFDALSDRQIKAFTRTAREQAALVLNNAENLLNARQPDLPEQIVRGGNHIEAVKKIALDFSYAQFPKLLDLDIEQLKQFDQLVQVCAGHLLDDLENLEG